MQKLGLKKIIYDNYKPTLAELAECQASTTISCE